MNGSRPIRDLTPHREFCHDFTDKSGAALAAAVDERWGGVDEQEKTHFLNPEPTQRPAP